ncbi:hypothetical protein HOLleu_19619 [Holothuria leucospilota]|uniref:exodeoxyribonuclease III n=1 Tax=Holothuria leucospilota TaxID=206669 RepID=A0A9Q1C0B9_HOLLE|nr:hypothetical protein HOLleu_19619 [Holothuria leucospilota]
MAIKIGSYNARGLRQPSKRRQQFAYLHRHHFDIVFIQETHSTSSDDRFWCNEWGGNILFSHGTSSSRGVAIFFRPGTSFDILKIHCDNSGRFVVADVGYGGSIFTLLSVYGPNLDSPNFYSNVSTCLSNFQCDNMICGGDFNFVFNLDLDKEGGARRTNFNARKDCFTLMEKI